MKDSLKKYSEINLKWIHDRVLHDRIARVKKDSKNVKAPDIQRYPDRLAAR